MVLALSFRIVMEGDAAALSGTMKFSLRMPLREN
jgi:hypothetical protein